MQVWKASYDIFRILAYVKFSFRQQAIDTFMYNSIFKLLKVPKNICKNENQIKNKVRILLDYKRFNLRNNNGG